MVELYEDEENMSRAEQPYRRDHRRVPGRRTYDRRGIPEARGRSSGRVLVALFVAAIAAVPGGRAAGQTATPGRDVHTETARLVAAGQEALEHAQYKLAGRHFSAADELAGGVSWDALSGLTTSWIQLGRFERAEDAARRLLQIAQSREQIGLANQLLGVALTGSGQLEEAEVALLKALGLRADRPLSTRRALALVLCNQGRFEEGLQLLDDGGLCSRKEPPPDSAEGAGRPIPPDGEKEPSTPVKLSGLSPAYPDAARISRVEGKVVLDTVIGSDGLVKCVRVLDSVSPPLSCSAGLTVLDWTFQPAFLDGEPVATRFILTVSFNVN